MLLGLLQCMAIQQQLHHFLKVHCSISAISVKAGLPNITGTLHAANIWNYVGQGSFKLTTETGTYPLGSGRYTSTVQFDASLSSSIYGSSNAVTPLSQSTLMLLKY